MSQPIGELLAADEGFFHQHTDTFATVATSDPAWTEKVCAMAMARDGSLQLGFGLGRYPNRNVLDGYAAVSRGPEQLTVRGSRRLAAGPEDLAVGPIRYEVVEPMRTVRFSLEANDCQPIAFDWTFTAELAPQLEERTHLRDQYRVSADLVRYHQIGVAEGWVEVDGERAADKRAEQESAGVRYDVGPPPTDTGDTTAFPAGVGFQMIWLPALMERADGSRYGLHLHYTLVEMPGFTQKTVTAGVEHPDGTREPIVDLHPELAFDPDNPRNLWVASQGNDGIVVVFDAGTEDQRTELFLDAFRNHFMEEVSSLAFGQPGTFATCQESRNTYDGQAPPNDFMGPALWPSDLDLFAEVFQNPFGSDLGSHLDMLHESPLCMGIAHYRNNEYFIFDGHNGHLVYYDFAADHGPGQDDHADGVIHRYTDLDLTRVEGVPGHMEYDPESNRVFIADTGASRIMTFEVGTGTRARDLIPTGESVADYAEYTGSTHSVFADQGLVRPSGLAIHDGRLFVSDHATGEIIAFDLETGEELDRVDTLSEELMGITVGPDGMLWMVDAAYSEVLRLQP